MHGFPVVPCPGGDRRVVGDATTLGTGVSVLATTAEPTVRGSDDRGRAEAVDSVSCVDATNESRICCPRFVRVAVEVATCGSHMWTVPW